jgi:hypothetical protein
MRTINPSRRLRAKVLRHARRELRAAEQCAELLRGIVGRLKSGMDAMPVWDRAANGSTKAAAPNRRGPAPPCLPGAR